MQYTLRSIPAALDRALRALARQQGKSLNEVAIRALAQAVGAGEAPPHYRQLGDLEGTWRDDPEFDDAVTALHRVDQTLWA